MWIPIVLLTIAWLSFLWTRRHLYALSWRIDGPPALPLLGNILSLWNENRNVVFVDKLLKYNSPSRVWLGPKLYIFIHDPKSIEELLRSRHCLDKPDDYGFVREALSGDGLLTSNGEHWRLHRKYLKPSLKDSTVTSHSTIFNYFFRELCNIHLTNEAKNGKVFDLLIPINVYLLYMYLEATFGQQWTERDEYSRKFHKVIDQVSRRIFRPWLNIKWIRMFTEYDAIMRPFQKYSTEMVTGIINRSIEEGTNNDSFIEKLIAISKENPDFNYGDVATEAHSLLIGATDTTGVALATTTLLMAIHQNAQQRLLEEVMTVMPHKDMDLSVDVVNKLPFLDACVRESMRLFPTVPLIARHPKEAIVLNGTEIPPGIPVVIGIRQVQRSTEYWGDDAHVFRPERFLVDNPPHKDTPGCYLPFSLGARNCIGYSFALFTIKLGLAHIIRNYHVTSPLKMSDLKIRLTVSFRLLKGTQVQVHRRSE